MLRCLHVDNVWRNFGKFFYWFVLSWSASVGLWLTTDTFSLSLFFAVLITWLVNAFATYLATLVLLLMRRRCQNFPVAKSPGIKANLATSLLVHAWRPRYFDSAPKVSKKRNQNLMNVRVNAARLRSDKLVITRFALLPDSLVRKLATTNIFELTSSLLSGSKRNLAKMLLLCHVDHLFTWIFVNSLCYFTPDVVGGWVSSAQDNYLEL